MRQLCVLGYLSKKKKKKKNSLVLVAPVLRKNKILFKLSEVN